MSDNNILHAGDVNLYHTDNGGDIRVKNGIVEMTGGLDTAVYLALFGGNQDDNGTNTTNKSWWGNLNETDDKQLRSRTQYILRNLPATSNNLIKLREAIEKDLQDLKDNDIATIINVSVSIIGLNMVNMNIDIFNVKQELIYQCQKRLEWFKQISE